MKTLELIFLVYLVLMLNGCGKNSSVNPGLETPETRKEIFNKIMNSHEYLSEFIQVMHGNQHAMMMMQEDSLLKGEGQMDLDSGNQAMGSGHMGANSHMGMNGNKEMSDRNYMMNMMHQNPAMAQQMMGNMIAAAATDSTTTRNMINMMSTHPAVRQMMIQIMNHQRGK